MMAFIKNPPTEKDHSDSSDVEISPIASPSKWQQVRHYLTSRDGWVGNYDYLYLVTPNIWPLNKKYRGVEPPFYGLNDNVPILLTILLGVQHALTMVGSVVSPPLAIAGGAFYLNSAQTQYLVSAAFITTGIATALQVTRIHITKTPLYIGTGLLSVVGPTFDILAVAFNYTDMRYAKGTCPTDSSGARLPCPEAWGAMLGTMLCTVWIQILMSLVPPKILNRIFPKIVTGSLLVLVGAYLISNGMQNWGGGSNCNGGSGMYALCPDIYAPKPLPWGDPKLIGQGFSVFVTIVMAEFFGSPLMRSASIILGLAVGCTISGATGYWSRESIDAAPIGTFLWVHTFKLSVDSALVLPLLIMFICEAVSCMPDILATAEISRVDIEGTEFNSRIQGGILCDGLGSLVSALGTGLPMVSQAGNNGVISLTGCASRRAGWCASAVLIVMGILGKFGAVFGSIPSSVLGVHTRNRFILTVALGIGFMDIVSPKWFSSVLTYSGSNVHLQGFEEGINLIVETPFIIAAVVGVILNAILKEETRLGDTSFFGHTDVRAVYTAWSL
ncbi:uncharacterized protein CDV56_104586 [Aspergillus thermomutatus]|uniref:Purine permease n=1 Tax=Aspergillus thermomutatus TaxID=41047 RepID=A0A397HG02_ASPTH|nr:uncharacterized protein CDV56_104586 [Aspergillus thermomutatus]RHZ61992.1 hypothetical protein CDV56_104586 [Aspergillus thermomutatus]